MPSNKRRNTKQQALIDHSIESAVMGQIYGIEKKRSTFLIVEYLLIIIIFLVLGVSAAITAINYLSQSETLTLFELFTQDPGTIRRYFWDTLRVIYIEIPKETILVALTCIILAFVTVILFRRKLPIIKSKFQSIKRYGNHHP